MLTYNDAWYNKSQTVKTYRTTYKSKDPKTKRRMHTDFSSALECMVGDVNLFFNDPHNETVAELELMIAGIYLATCCFPAYSVEFVAFVCNRNPWWPIRVG